VNTANVCACLALRVALSLSLCCQLTLLLVQVLVDHKLQSAALRRQIDQIGREREALEAKRDDITRAVNDVSGYTSAYAML
jgi:hypothetical protein